MPGLVASRLATTAVTLAACWPATGGGPDRRAYNGLETAVTAAAAPTLVEVWTATTDAGQRGVSSAVVSTDGLVHVTTESSVYGIDLRTGAVRWVESPYAGTGGVAMDTELAIGPPTGDLTLYVSIARGPVGWENAVFDTRDGSWISEPFGRQRHPRRRRRARPARRRSARTRSAEVACARGSRRSAATSMSRSPTIPARPA